MSRSENINIHGDDKSDGTTRDTQNKDNLDKRGLTFKEVDDDTFFNGF